MVMLDKRLYLVGIVELIRRSHVDRGTNGSRVVVGTDLFKQKVTILPLGEWFDSILPLREWFVRW